VSDGIKPESSLHWLSDELNRLKAEGLLRRRRIVNPLPDGACELDGAGLLNFATNDYLGLAGDARLRAAAVEAQDDAGTGARASALVCGRTRWHERLENELARFEGTEAALVFPTGYAANVGTLTALIQPDDVVFCDRLNHASLIDGCRLSGARFRVYRHDRLEVLERELQSGQPAGHRRWIVTDTVFSMDGALAPLPELCALAERYGARLIVDEAHGTGVFGERGRGVCETTQTEHRVAARIGTLSKAVGTLGGFVAGSQILIEWLWNSARSQMFSTALPAPVCAAATESLRIIQAEPERRIQLLDRSQLLRDELERVGCPPMVRSCGPIVPVVLGAPAETTAAAARMEAEGFLVAAIRPPTVPQGTSRLRMSVSSAHSELAVKALAIAVARAVG